jgi:hypothetical protein
MVSEFPLPLFGYLIPDASGAAFLVAASGGRFLPLFTSLENATEYARRSRLNVALIELSTAEAALQFIERPPSRVPHHIDTDYRIVIDPIAPDTGEYMVYDRAELIRAWRKALDG